MSQHTIYCPEGFVIHDIKVQFKADHCKPEKIPVQVRLKKRCPLCEGNMCKKDDEDICRKCLFRNINSLQKRFNEECMI